MILPYEPTSYVGHSKFHQHLMYAACKDKSATAAPRGSLKSYIFSKYRPLHVLCDPDPTRFSGHVDYVMISEAVRLTCDHLDWIKWHLENNQILKDRYGNLADPSRMTWNKDEIELVNGHKVKCFGYDSAYRGQHPTDAIVDDLESDKNVRTEESLTTMKDWFFRVFMPSLLPETRVNVIGTIICKNSLLDDLIKAPTFAGKLWKAINATEPVAGEASGGETSIWPDRWPLKWLQDRRKEYGHHRFEAEYQNNPTGPKERIIYEEWIKRFTPDQVAAMAPIKRYICCDPAFTEERWGDYSAIFIMDLMPDGRLFERLAWKKKVTGPDLENTLISFYNHFKQGVDCIMGIEEVAAQKMLRQGILAKDPTIKVVPVKPHGKDKTTRLIDVSRYLELGIVHLSTESFIDELLQFPVGQKDRCFVAGTKVATPSGDKNIEDFEIGDKIIGPYGIDTVLEKHISVVASSRIIEKFGLKCTDDHKVLDIVNGYVSISSIDRQSSLSSLNLKEMMIWRIQKLLSLMESNISCTGRSDIISHSKETRTMFCLLSRCTSLLGNFIIERKFRKIISFIIKMVTLLITTLKTWSVYHVSNTLRCIGSQLASVKLSILQRLGRKLKRGTLQKKEEDGIGNMPSKFGKILKLLSEYVCTVVNRLRHFIEIRSAVVETVSITTGLRIAKKNFDYAQSVERPLRSGYHQPEELAARVVAGTIVHNLKTTSGMYYANGILVSNCDAFVYCLKLYEQDHPIINDSSFKEIDTLKNMCDDTLNVYLENAKQGIPNHDVPKEYVDRVTFAEEVEEFLDDPFG